MRITRMVYLGLVLVLAMLSLPGMASAQGEGRGTSEAASLCKKGGWQNLYDASGSTFKNQGDCVSYVVQGGVPAKSYLTITWNEDTTTYTAAVTGAGLDPSRTVLVELYDNDWIWARSHLSVADDGTISQIYPEGQPLTCGEWDTLVFWAVDQEGHDIQVETTPPC